MPARDLLVRGGTLIDPAQSISARRDVAFHAGGALVTPGLIDLHTHVYHGLATGRHADQTCLANGVTTVVDAGTAGWMTVRGLRDYVIPTYQTRVFVFLHISATGLVINRVMPELAEIAGPGDDRRRGRARSRRRSVHLHGPRPQRGEGRAPLPDLPCDSRGQAAAGGSRRSAVTGGTRWTRWARHTASRVEQLFTKSTRRRSR